MLKDILGTWLTLVLKKFTVAFAVLLATWQLIVRSHGIVVFLFYDPAPLARLSQCNNPPSCLQLLFNLFSNPLSLLMWYLPNSVRTLLISKHNLLNEVISQGNLRMLFNSLRTRNFFYFTAVLAIWTLKLCLLHKSDRSLLSIHHIFPRILLYSPSMLPIHIPRKLCCHPCSSHNLYTSLKWIIEVRFASNWVQSWTYLCATQFYHMTTRVRDPMR